MGAARPRGVLVAALLGGCGRVGFESQDTATDAPRQPGLVAMSHARTGDNANVAMLAVTIPQSIAGDLLVVAIAEHNGDSIASVVDDAQTPFTSAGARAAMGSTASELWYEPSAASTA